VKGGKSVLDEIDAWWIFVAIFGGSVGLAYFVYGRKAERYLFLLFGFLIMAMPFVFRTALTLTITSVVGIILPFILIRFGIDF
jgi:hypothetical protein